MVAHIDILAKEFGWNAKKMATTVELLDEGNTVPFIARYRKEMTGEMDETVLRQVLERLQYLRNLAKRKEDIIQNIEEQGKMSEELKAQILAANILQEVEDLYLPYKQKRKTRASVAKEKGLEPLAIALMDKLNTIQGEVLAQAYINIEKDVADVQQALAGALDIIAEMIADDAHLRKIARNLSWQQGKLSSKANDLQVVTPYEMYYQYDEAISKIPPHRILAMNRGEQDKALVIKVQQPEELIISAIEEKYCLDLQSNQTLILEGVKDSFKRLIAPAIERELRNQLTEVAQEQAIKVFAKNLHSLLLQAPVKGKIVLGLDPGFRTGCKLAVVDDTGKVLEIAVIYPHPPQKKYQEALNMLGKLVEKWSVDIVAIGNGTASRESEALVAELISQYTKVQYIIVSEAGASVYSASKIAKEEFPDYDLSLRSAVSIARRLQDPLAELVKIEPKAVGVGQYQHDVAPKRLDEALGAVVEDCVNSVGVEVNTASGPLLQYIAGLTKATADGIVQFRNEVGKINNRKQLLKVPRLGPKAYTQCAGFIRISDGEEPLDNTPVHPESYESAKRLLGILGFTSRDLKGDQLVEIKKQLEQVDIKAMAKELQIGEPTLKDMIQALQKPGRDPRDTLTPPLLRSDVLSMEDLKVGMDLMGTVRNVVDFGAFVDLGVKHDGLVHISQIGNKFIKHPMEVLSVGDIIPVRVIEIDLVRNRIGLTMKIGDE